MSFTRGLLLSVAAVTLLAFVCHAAIGGKSVEVGTASHSISIDAGGESESGVDDGKTWFKTAGHGAKVALGNNANAVLSLDLIADGGAGNRRNDGVTTGAVSGRGTTIAIEIFATGVTTSLRGAIIRFDFDASLVTYIKAENNAFPLSIPEGSVGVNLASTSPVSLASSGFLARAEFETAADVTGREFSIGVERVTIAESVTSSDDLTTGSVITFNAPGSTSPDFDGDGTVGFPDFLAFAGSFGASRGDARYEARYDLDGDGSVAFSDFLIFAGAFGSEVPPSGGGGGTPAGSAPADQNAFDRLVVGKRILGETAFVDVVSAARFTEGFERNQGRYTYTNSGPNTGNLTLFYDDSELFGGRCTVEMTFATEATGTMRYACDDGTAGDVEAWRTTDLSAPVFARATTDTLYFIFLDTWRAGETRAYDFELRTKAPRGEWDEFCLTFTNPGDNVFIGYVTTWFFGQGLESGTTYEMRYRYRNSSSCETGSPGPWSPIAEGTTAASGTGGGGGGTNTPPIDTSQESFDLHYDNGDPAGIAYANGRIYVIDRFEDTVFAYQASGQRDATVEFDLHDDNADPSEIAFASGRFYVVDDPSGPEANVYAYRASGQRDGTADFGFHDDNIHIAGIVYASGLFYVPDSWDVKVYAYQASGQRDVAAEFDLHHDNQQPAGIAYASGRFYIVDWSDEWVYAYQASGQRDVAAEFDLHHDNGNPTGIAYANGMFYVVDRVDDKVYVYSGDSGGSGGGGGSSPDLIVASPSVDDNTLTTGQAFAFSATVRNQGNASATATTLRYYRSANATVSTEDTEVGTDAVSGLSPGGTSAESISLNAPSDAGTYYYGACVDGVSDESNTGNNCSSGVTVTVSSGTTGGGSLGACRVGLVVRPNQSCTVGGGAFRNIGGGCYNYTPFGSGRFCGANFNLNGLQGTRVGNDYRITAVP